MELWRSRNVCPFLHGSEAAQGLFLLQLVVAGQACIYREHPGMMVCLSLDKYHGKHTIRKAQHKGLITTTTTSYHRNMICL